METRGFLDPVALVGPDLLPIREAYEWKRPAKPRLSRLHPLLLPIREAYEWKRSVHTSIPIWGISSCFQFVKRMNGNRQVTYAAGPNVHTCFQFVKRMNGN